MTEPPKLEAVGLLAGPVAHDLGSTLQCVSNNLEFLDEAFRDLVALVAPNPNNPDAGPERAYLTAEIPRSIRGAQDAVQRAAGIVCALRDLSMPQAERLEEFDVNRGLQSALAVAETRIRHTARIHTNLGDIPAIVGRRRDLNQAFLHLLMHAADTIETAHRSELGSIRVWTELHDRDVRIGFEDDGSGQRSGPGLTAAEALVHRHGGQVAIDAREGQGTTVILRLPQKPPHDHQQARP